MEKTLEQEIEELVISDPLHENVYELEEYPILDGKKHPFAVICPGGAYGMVCSFVEGLPFARKLNEQGFAAFIVRYRCREKATYPAPMDDLARAVKDIFSRTEELGLDPDHYSVWGSSAGGHLAASFGTENMGYVKYNLPKPNAMVLCYPVISMGEYTHPETRFNLLGEHPTEEMIHFASVEEQVTDKYPPTFVFHGAEDGAVPPQNSRMLVAALQARGIPCWYTEYPGIEHGVGLAKGQICEDWFSNAVRFLREFA
jgi:acetyl esterase/lipase